MRGLVKAVFALSCLLLIPSAAYAQGAIAGTVKDASGAVLPGVTVEAASPVLIEKTRSVVSDGSGNYQHRGLAARHLHGHVHADWLQHREARRASLVSGIGRDHG